jgi:hypothetical protein
MSITEMIKQYKAEGIAQDFVIYADIDNNSDEPIPCTAEEADNAGAVVRDIQYIEMGGFFRVMVIYAEVAEAFPDREDLFRGTMLVKDLSYLEGLTYSARVIAGTWVYMPKLKMWAHNESNVWYDARRCERIR